MTNMTSIFKSTTKKYAKRSELQTMIQVKQSR